MKKLYFLAAMVVAFAACQPQNQPEQNNNQQSDTTKQDTTHVEPVKTLAVATFEEGQLPAESVYHMDSTGFFQSGGFYFMQEVADYGDYGVYYFGNIISNKTGKTYDFYADSDKSASGGAYEGNNFVVWTGSYAGYDMIMLSERALVPGMYVNNTAWVVDAIVNGDGMSVDPQDTTKIGTPFGPEDYLVLSAGGFKLDKTAAGKDTAIVTDVTYMYLAKGTSYIKDWTYMDLSKLGEIDAIKFQLISTKENANGMTTPNYFCIDNFGAEKKK